MSTVESQNASVTDVAETIWKFGGLSVQTLLKRVWTEIYAGNLLTHAAALSFYFLLALFPLLLFLVTILGFFTEYGSRLRVQLLFTLSGVVPRSASALINATVDEIGKGADGGKLSFGLLTALWVASSGMGAISESLNAMYGVRESRTWWRVRALAIGLTIMLAVLILTALLCILFGGEIGESIARYFNQDRSFATFWTLIQIPIVLAFVMLAFALIYYFAPDVYEQKWYWITPGSIVGVLLWLLVSFGFRLYLQYFDSYSVTYGSLGAVIILMLWFYLTGVAILIGGKINAEIENAAAKAGLPDAKHHGEKATDD